MNTIHSYTVTVLMWVHDGQMEQFHAYERAVKPLIEACGGVFTAVYTPTFTIGMETPPDEVHVIRFEDENGLKTYLNQPKPESLIALRTAIRQTIVIAGTMIETTDQENA